MLVDMTDDQQLLNHFFLCSIFDFPFRAICGLTFDDPFECVVDLFVVELSSELNA